METSLILKKDSGEGQIRAYFRKIVELKQSGNEFPVDLDEVWQLVYSSKHKAVNELLNSKDEYGNQRYSKEIDFEALNQTVEAGAGLSKRNIYKISIPCLEYFIARKVRSVFEIYSKVFHTAVEQKRKAGNENALVVQNVKAIESKLDDANTRLIRTENYLQQVLGILSDIQSQTLKVTVKQQARSKKVSFDPPAENFALKEISDISPECSKVLAEFNKLFFSYGNFENVLFDPEIICGFLNIGLDTLQSHIQKLTEKEFVSVKQTNGNWYVTNTIQKRNKNKKQTNKN